MVIPVCLIVKEKRYLAKFSTKSMFLDLLHFKYRNKIQIPSFYEVLTNFDGHLEFFRFQINFLRWKDIILDLRKRISFIPTLVMSTAP
jgi:hypothetical protein